MQPVVAVPPLMSEEQVTGDPLDVACDRARAGCDAGLVLWRISADHVEAALVFAPDVPLNQAMIMLPLCGVGLQNALGALAPPEVAIHLGWDGSVTVNGAACGALRIRASETDPAKVPDWLVVGLRLRLMPESLETGLTPDQTSLMSEGCGDILPQDLISAWARHVLQWINRWEGEGPRALHEMWAGLAIGIGQEIRQFGQVGEFLGVDEDFGMLIRAKAGDTQVLPLRALLGEER